MRVDDLRAFLELAHQGNLRRAAERLASTPSALSKALARLEAEIGLVLFERTARGVVLTASGETLRAHAARVNLALGDMESAMREEKHARAGTVRVGILPSMIPTLLAPPMAAFIASRPLASFAIEAHLSARLLDMLRAGELDIAVAALPATPLQGLVHTSLGPLTIHVVAREGHPRAARTCHLAELANERWVLPAAPQFLRAWIEQRFAAAGLPRPGFAVESSTSGIPLIELIRRSDLLGIMPATALDKPGSHGLALVSIQDLTWQHELVLCHREDAYLSPMCRDFSQAIVTHCRLATVPAGAAPQP